MYPNPNSDIITGSHIDHTLGNRNADLTQTDWEKSIDAANGLRGTTGHIPTEEDFAGLLSPEGDSGDIVGADVSDSAFVFGEDGSLGGTL